MKIVERTIFGASPRAFRVGAVLAAAAVLWGGNFAMSAEPAAKEAPAQQTPAKQPPAKDAPAAAPAKESTGKTSEAGEVADWPCEQKYVDQLSYGTMWSGPPLDNALKSWHQNDGLREIVTYLTDENTEEADGVKAIDEFAAKLGADKNKQLTELFAALFETMNDKRTSDQEGIKKYFHRQEAAAQRVNKIQADLRGVDVKGAKPDDPKLAELKKNLAWNNRIYDEGQTLVPYICQIPLILEQKLGAYGRAIQGHMKG